MPGKQFHFYFDKENQLQKVVFEVSRLEKFEALKKAYEHYKTMESLCFDEPVDDENK